MKAEPRGKYPGLKLHLDEKECQQLLDWYKASGSKVPVELPLKFTKDVAKTISKLLVDAPDMLQARTETQIAKALKKDQEKISEQLAAMDAGQDWKKVK